MHRPKYHMMPSHGWMNDPNGILHWNGQYHLFYQCNPNRAVWGNMHWGHAVTSDFVYWRHRPVALAPTPNGADQDGCWSGCGVAHEGVARFFYTGARKIENDQTEQTQMLVYGEEDLTRWRKYEGNPIIAAPPKGEEFVAFRDPAVWRSHDKWYMLVGAGIKDVGGAILLYQSQDLTQWDYVGIPLRANQIGKGSVWECPQLFGLGDKDMLTLCEMDDWQSVYMLGYFDDHQFTPEVYHPLDLSRYYYAPQSIRDVEGRRVIFAWLREGRSVESAVAEGWSGVQALPRVLSLREDGRLGITPLPALQQIRHRHHHFSEVSPTESLMAGDALEILAEIPPSKGEVSITMLRSPDGEEQTRIVYDFKTARLWIDRERSSLASDVERDPHGGEHLLDEGEPLRLHIFLDRSTLEVFANERTTLSSRIYPTRDDSLQLGIEASLPALDVWELGSIW